MLYALPAVLLPLLIHLLNRLRYKTVPWAAMMFLLKANKSATRRAKVRQYLLLASRMLLILFLIWAMSRPLIGGWIGAAAGGAPETVLILLDRSASMEATGPDRQESRREHALKLLEKAAQQSEGSRFVLIESALRQPVDVAGGAALSTLSLATATDAAADIPAMLRTALEYLNTNKPGSAEIWLASDLQASSWRPDHPDWQDLSARFAALPQQTPVRIVDLSMPVQKNSGIVLRGVDFRTKNQQGKLALALEIRSTDGSGSIPLTILRDGVRSQQDVAMASALQRQVLRFDIPRIDPGGGHGEISLPADENRADNVVHFVYAPPVPLTTVVVGDHPSCARLTLAAAPDPARTERKALHLQSSRGDAIPWKDAALVVWQGGAPSENVGKSLQSFVESGGVVVCFPPVADASSAPFGISWQAPEPAPIEGPFRVATWDDLDGPLAKTDSGQPLPLARLEVFRRQAPALNDPAVHVYGTFADGKTFLAGRRIGAGQVFACATLPDAEWSSLEDGFVMLPMIQRLLALGASRIAPPTLATVGEWKPAEPQEVWRAVDTEERRDWRWNAGVYQNSGRRIALNRPESEDNADAVGPDKLPEMLKGVKLTVMTGAIELKADRLQTEIWQWMVVVAMLAMCLEMFIATSKPMLPVRPGQTAPKAAASRPGPPSGNAAASNHPQPASV